MQVSYAVFYTLATLVASNVQERAIAVSRSQTTTPAEKASNLVVPVTEGIPARIKTIAPPDTVVIPQFSPNYANVQTSTNNPVVILSLKRRRCANRQGMQANRSMTATVMV